MFRRSVKMNQTVPRSHPAGDASEGDPCKPGVDTLKATSREQHCASGLSVETPAVLERGLSDAENVVPLTSQEPASALSSAISTAVDGWGDWTAANSVGRLKTPVSPAAAPAALCRADVSEFFSDAGGALKSDQAPPLSSLAETLAAAKKSAAPKPSRGEKTVAAHPAQSPAAERVSDASDGAQPLPTTVNESVLLPAINLAEAALPSQVSVQPSAPPYSLSLPLALPPSRSLESADTTPTSAFSPSSLSRLGLSPSSLLLLRSLTPEQQLAALSTATRAGTWQTASPSLGPANLDFHSRTPERASEAGDSPFRADSASFGCSSYTRSSSTLSLSPESAAKRRKTVECESKSATLFPEGVSSPRALLDLLTRSLAPSSLVSSAASSVSNSRSAAVSASADGEAVSLASLSPASLSPALLSRLTTAFEAPPAAASCDSVSAVLQQLEAAALLASVSATPAPRPASADLHAPSPLPSSTRRDAPASLSARCAAALASDEKSPRASAALDVAAALAVLQQHPSLLASLRATPSQPHREAASPRQEAGRSSCLAHAEQKLGSCTGTEAPDGSTPRARGKGRQAEKARARATSKVPAGVETPEGEAEDFASRARRCEHVPGVCFDRWNQGWIATWRERRHPVHKHFSAKKYGFEKARELAIEHRRLMVEKQRQDGATPATRTPRGNPGNAFPTSRKDEEHTTLTPGKPRASPTAGSPRRARGLAGGTENGGETAGGSARRGKFASAAASARALCVADNSVGKREMSWAELVAQMPRVERVSFDFTNQSWIAQWKQQGSTTYRRFSVSKFGFYGAHRLAVEFKQQNYRQLPAQKAASPDAAPLTAVCVQRSESAEEEVATPGGGSKRAASHVERGRRLPRGVQTPPRAASLKVEANRVSPRSAVFATAPAGAAFPKSLAPEAAQSAGNSWEAGMLDLPPVAASLFGLSPASLQAFSPVHGLSGEATALNTNFEDSTGETGSTQVPSGAESPVAEVLSFGSTLRNPCLYSPVSAETTTTAAGDTALRLAARAAASSVCSRSLPLATGSATEAPVLLPSKLSDLPALAPESCASRIASGQDNAQAEPLASQVHLTDLGCETDASIAVQDALPSRLPLSASLARPCPGARGDAHTQQTDEGDGGGEGTERAGEKETPESAGLQSWPGACSLAGAVAAKNAGAHAPGCFEERGQMQIDGGARDAAIRVASSTTTTSPHDEEASAAPGGTGASNAFAAPEAFQTRSSSRPSPPPRPDLSSLASSAAPEQHAVSSVPEQKAATEAGVLPLYKIALCCLLTDLKINCRDSLLVSRAQAPSLPGYLDLVEALQQRVAAAAELKDVAALCSVFSGFLRNSLLPSSCSPDVQVRLLHALAEVGLDQRRE
ncbi:AP2 domain transcription factor AP2X-11 [Toxoplasma gondii VEG]|uniref:AP2 domain transcription factor AP2X-11 n=2 Tax=Toxoplasma gondii (strain ATCC 50861 / VEG) TaxID=432359 RepID=V4Z772_TOXGV|nr:AP2 domain transcription factor AP2X-11 [Toxoplasma gondii VEG]